MTTGTFTGARRRWLAATGATLGAALAPPALRAQTAGDRALPPPQTDGGRPLMQALTQRRTTRSFADRPLAPQMLSNLLWAAFGVNRPDGRRTAPSARNWQEIDVYVALADGLFAYDAGAHALKRIVAADLRSLAGTQAHARAAPATLVYVADESRMGGADDRARATYAAADAGFIAQNVYLFCASEGLGAVVFASIDRERFAQAAGLRRDQRVVLGQSVGYPAP